MKVLNVHTRTIPYPYEAVVELLSTLATADDKVWPKQHWPAMRFKDGLAAGSRGGHGPIRYTIDSFQPDKLIQFKFVDMNGWNGIHRFEIKPIPPNSTHLVHVIDMNATGSGLIKWSLATRWLHDALIEDAFDKIENHFSPDIKKTKWSWWVKFLRFLLK